MKKEYVSPQMDYWCYIAGKLCAGVGAKRWALSITNPDSEFIPSSGGTEPRF